MCPGAQEILRGYKVDGNKHRIVFFFWEPQVLMVFKVNKWGHNDGGMTRPMTREHLRECLIFFQDAYLSLHDPKDKEEIRAGLAATPKTTIFLSDDKAKVRMLDGLDAALASGWSYELTVEVLFLVFRPTYNRDALMY